MIAAMAHSSGQRHSSGYDPARHGPTRIVGEGFHAQVYDVVRGVPAGSITTFGDVAGQLGSRNVARHVGFALAALPDDSDVPWHRVITSTGRLPSRADGQPSADQQRLLEGEGHTINDRGRVEGFGDVRHLYRA